MPRVPRNFEPGEIYHVFSRGSNRQDIFKFDSDRTDFLGCLDRVVARYRLECLAYCLMPNHFHLVVETPDGRLSEAMKSLNGRYALRFNLRYGRDAHLFRNRFGAVLQESDAQLFWTLRYTIRNPVESGLCVDPSEWPWSSYRASVGEVKPPRLLALGKLFAYLADTPDLAMYQFRTLVDL
jgi:putative transposase